MSLRQILNRMQAAIDELYNLAKRGANATAAMQNRTYSSTLTLVSPHTPNTGSALFIAAMTLTPRVSGRFHVGFMGGFTAATPTDTVDFQVTTQTNPGIALTGGTNAAPPLSPGGALVSSGVGGILVTGGPFNSQVWWDSGVEVFGTAATTGQIAWDGVIDMNGTTGYAIGKPIAFLLSENLSGGVTTFATNSFSMFAYELP